MSLRNEDRELQIRLAELQADVQINLTLGFGFLATFLAIVIGVEQILPSLQPRVAVVDISLIILAVVATLCLFYFALHFLRKAQDARNQIKELRKKYVW